MLRGWKWTEEDEQACLLTVSDGSEDKIKRALEEERMNESQHYKVPLELQALFTPAEIEELKTLFDELDSDNSGAIDAEELKTVFDRLDEDITTAQLEELLDTVDDDESGVIEFAEFVLLMSKFKSGDSKFAKLTNFFDKMQDTPLNILQRECDRRSLQVDYVLDKVLPPTSMHPMQFVVAAKIHGEWREILKNDQISVKVETREFEGIGKNTRTAKFNAATTALSKLRAYIPGIDFEPGVIPPAWMRWFGKNIDRGVDEIKLLEKLSLKGFYPSKNVIFMQTLSLRVTMRDLNKANPELWTRAKGKEVPVEYLNWARHHMRRGIHGKAILKLLVENGYNPEKNPVLTKLLRKDVGGSYSDKIRPHQIDFWHSAGAGEVDELVRYVAAGQDPNETKTVLGQSVNALTLAINNNQVEACKFLVEHGARLDHVDQYGRLCTHLAAQKGSKEILEFLISRSADVFRIDKYGETPLHLAASHGHRPVVDFLLDWYSERVRRVVGGMDVLQGEAERFIDTARVLYDHVLKEKLSSFATPIFKKQWMPFAMSEYYKLFNGKPFAAPIETETAVYANDEVADFVQNEDPRKTYIFPESNAQNVYLTLYRYAKDKSRPDMDFEEFALILERALYTSWVHFRNGVGRTPLVCAADPPGELSAAHQTVIQSLMDYHGCDVGMKDKFGRFVSDLIRFHLRRLGGNHLDELVSQEKARKEEAQAELLETQEPLAQDPLYKVLCKAGEVQAQWMILLAASSTVRSVTGFSEMYNPDSGNFFYVNEQRQCQWSKPSAFVELDKTMYGWMHIKKNSLRIKTVKPWDVYNMKASGQRFYHNHVDNVFSWECPKEIQESLGELRKPQHDPGRAEMLTKLGFWTKWHYPEHEQVYFVNEKHDIIQYERPLEWSHYIDEKDIVPEKAEEDWYSMGLSSDTIRAGFDGGWEERRDLFTKLIFYWNSQLQRGCWDRPLPVMELEQKTLLYTTLLGRENGRKRKRLQVLQTKEDPKTGLSWREELDTFRDKSYDSGIRTMMYYVAVDKKGEVSLAQGTPPPLFEQPEVEEDTKTVTEKERTQAEAQKRREMSKVAQQIDPVVNAKKAATLKRILVWVEAAEERSVEGYIMCAWGCKEWIAPEDVDYHQTRTCRKRQLDCERKCGLVLRAEQWDACKDIHLDNECIKREVYCELLCGQLLQFDKMQHHLDNECGKRKVPPRPCKFACGWQVQGGVEDLEHMAWEANEHESHFCPLRIVRCDWLGCMVEMEARTRYEHRQRHLARFGIITWTTAGEYKWKVPRRIKSILLQIWGAGGGSGMLKGRRGGCGGGGGFIEAEMKVAPGEELTIVVGSGGEARNDEVPEGYKGDENLQRPARGGYPGGGAGMSNNYCFSCGGGGGYSAVFRTGILGQDLVALAGGGGGGGTRDGNPGGIEKFDTVDFDGVHRNGSQGSATTGGVPGETPDEASRGEPGQAYQGGAGGKFGGGGGSGVFGGGGGGYTPGVVGGGGGGASYVDKESQISCKMEHGKSFRPGGCDQDIPAATGVGDWDLNQRHAGFGGEGKKHGVQPGCSGAVRIRLPDYHKISLPETRLPTEVLHEPPPDDGSSCVTCRELEELQKQEKMDAEAAAAAAYLQTNDGNSEVQLGIEKEQNEEEEEEEDEEGAYELPEELYELPEFEESPFVPGARVMCFYQGSRNNPQYAGTISDVNHDGTFEIDYDDGDTDSSIPESFLSLL